MPGGVTSLLQTIGTDLMKLLCYSVTCLSVFTLSLLLQSGRLEAGLIYDEAIDGDIPAASGAPVNLGELMVGSNTISGSRSVFGNIRTGFTTLDLDSFQVDLTPGLQIDDVTIEITSFQSTDNWAAFQLRPPRSRFLPTERLTRTGTWSFKDFGLSTPVATEGSYSLNPAAGSTLLQFDISYAYTVTFEVSQSAVPEPSSLAILGTGALGLMTVRHRRD